MASQAELAAMRQAILLSALGLGTTSPNPPVGCVILDTHGTPVGAGFHRRKGEPHAEVNALAAAGTAARGGTAVVTLEPCNHVGVTPACRQELLDAGIARVVLGVIDPTSRGDGGAAVLAGAGVDVETGVLHEEVFAVLGPWLTATRRRCPYVTWAHKSQQEPDRPADDRHLAILRGTADVVLDGAAVSEGVPGGHSAVHFRLPDLDQLGEGLAPWLDDAYRNGARRVLLISSEPEPTPGYLPLIDELWLALCRTNPPRASTPISHQLSDAGFQIVDIIADQVTITAHLRQTGFS
ncbi:hypothetical protein [Dactylosporangium salmoneum]|uniref:CMP/dCMP-type deaminase domain-containing protein n=1 Tax=Dactylosporangium salmoneum TaxID=53361 RepID=A0ABP5T2P8_9ACTN